MIYFSHEGLDLKKLVTKEETALNGRAFQSNATHEADRPGGIQEVVSHRMTTIAAVGWLSLWVLEGHLDI